MKAIIRTGDGGPEVLQLGEVPSPHPTESQVLVDIHATASFESFTSAEDLAFLRGLIAGWFFAPETMGAAIRLGVATQDAFDGWRDGVERWMTDPGAFAAIAWGEAVGRKP